VRQQNSGAVEDFNTPYSAVYLRIQKWKNYWNRSTFAKVIVKIKVARFFMAHGVLKHTPDVRQQAGYHIKHTLLLDTFIKFHYHVTLPAQW